MYTTSVIIPTTYGGLTHLSRLLPGLANECKETNSEIIVVDNNSRDGTAQYLSNYECTVIFNKTNKGFSAANNQGVRISQSDNILLLNNDTVITPHVIKEMADLLNSDKKIGIVGCLLLRTVDNKVQHAGVCFTQDYVPYELGLEISGITPGINRNDDRVNTVREVPSVTAACMMIKKSVWQAIGGMDEEYKNGWEDTDFVLKAKELGYSVWYTGRAKVYHEHFGSKISGRLNFEKQNRDRYDRIWVHTGRAKTILGDRREF